MQTRAVGVGRTGVVRRAALVALVGLATLGLASCADETERLTAAELAARGDGICRKLDADVKQLGTQFDDTIVFPPDQMQALFTKMVPLVDRAINDFKALEPPKDIEGKYDDALAQMEKDREALVAGTKSPEAAKTLFDAQVDPFESTKQKLAAVGITACSGEGAVQGDADVTDTTTTTAP